MLDFKELSVNGNELELLIREILFSKNLNVYWSGIGADGGKDLLCVERIKSVFFPSEKRWLIQCKHNAHSGNSVGVKDLDNIVDSCNQHSATGYLLVCSTYPSSAVVNRLEEITKNTTNNITATYWDAVLIERMLKTPREWRIAQKFFPKSSSIEGWQIYATEKPNNWIVNYKGYYFHIYNRIRSYAEIHLESIKNRICDIERLNLPEGHILRPRAVNYDDKNGNYMWYLDYLYPSGCKEIISIDSLKRKLHDGYALEDGQCYQFDILDYEYLEYSDHYDPDHYDYYVPFLGEFSIGSYREVNYSRRIEFSRQDFVLLSDNEDELQQSFDSLIKTFSSLDFIKVIRAINSNIDHIDKFYYLFDWTDLISSIDYEVDVFFSAKIIFSCTDFIKLKKLVSSFPQEVLKHFMLEKSYLFIPENEMNENKDNTYNLILSIHPGIIKNKFTAKKAFIEYFDEIKSVIEEYQY